MWKCSETVLGVVPRQFVSSIGRFTSSSVGDGVPAALWVSSVIMPWLCMRRGVVKRGTVVVVNVLWHGLTAGVVVVGCQVVTGFG